MGKQCLIFIFMCSVEGLWHGPQGNRRRSSVDTYVTRLLGCTVNFKSYFQVLPTKPAGMVEFCVCKRGPPWAMA